MLLVVTWGGHSQNNMCIKSKALEEDLVQLPTMKIVEISSFHDLVEEDNNLDEALSRHNSP